MIKKKIFKIVLELKKKWFYNIRVADYLYIIYIIYYGIGLFIIAPLMSKYN